MDIGTGLALFGSAKMIEKMLGPTAEYLGDGLKNWTEKRITNTKRIFENAGRKVGSNINSKGGVSPQVLRGILGEGSWCEEDVQIEYFGGVLASARSENLRDDRAVYFINLISRLTIYQLRLHFIVYSHFRDQFLGQNGTNFYDSSTCKQFEIFISFKDLEKAMDLNAFEKSEGDQIFGHSMIGLHKEELFSHVVAGTQEDVQMSFKNAPDAGAIFQPSAVGVDLFLWAHGRGKKRHDDFFSSNIQNELDLILEFGTSIQTKICS